MVPYDHARLHARDFGGHPRDYLPVDEFLDQTKCHLPDFRHRLILHNAFGMGLAERVLGPAIRNAAGEMIAVREIARRHIIEDCQRVPTLAECVELLQAGNASTLNRPSPRALRWLRENPVEFYEEDYVI